MKNPTKKMRSNTDSFKLHFEMLPSEDAIVNNVRQLRRKQTIQLKKDALAAMVKILMIPGIAKKMFPPNTRTKQ